MNIDRTGNLSLRKIIQSSKPTMNKCCRINKKQGSNRTTKKSCSSRNHHNDIPEVYNSQPYEKYMKQKEVLQLKYKLKNSSQGDCSGKYKICFPTSFNKNNSRTGSTESVTRIGLKTLNTETNKPPHKCITQKENLHSYSCKQNDSLLLCRRKVESHYIKHCTPDLLMKRQVLMEHRELGELPKVNYRCQVQSNSEHQFHINLNCKCCHETRRVKEIDQTGKTKNIFLSPKLSTNKSFDNNTRIQYQLANKLMPVSTSEDLIFYKKIIITTHSSKSMKKYCQRNLLDKISDNTDQPNSYMEIPPHKIPLQKLPIRKNDESLIFSCKSSKMSSSSLFSLGSSESYSSTNKGTYLSTSLTSENILQLLHPHWRRVPHKSYFGWTKNHEHLFNELQTKVQEGKIPSAYYRIHEEYIEEIRKIKEKSNLQILKGPVVVHVIDILDLIHKTHALSIESSNSKQAVLYKMDAYDADNDEIDDYCDL